MLNLNKLNKNLVGIFMSTILLVGSNFTFANESSTRPQVSAMQPVRDNQILDIDFLYKQTNKGSIDILTNSYQQKKIKVKRDDNLFTVVIPDIFLPKQFVRKMIVKDFDTTVEQVDSYMIDNNTYIKISTKSKSSLTIKEVKNKISLIVDKDIKKNRVKDESNYGKPISIEFNDIEVRDLLRVLAQYTELNIIASDSVSGNITISFNEVPFEHALEVILQSKGLDKRIMHNIIYIAPSNEIEAIEENKLAAKQKLDELAPLESKFFQIKYAKAEDISSIIEAIKTERGKIIVDNRTNNLIVKDTNKNLEIIKNTINKLDVPIRQVLIEARIVIAKKTKSQELGIKWGGMFSDGKTFASGDYNKLINSYTNGEYNSSSTPIVDLGVANPAGSLAFGLKSSTTLLEMELSALEENGDGEVISRPKIVTADKKTASIKSGSQIPYQQSAGTGVTSTSFKDAVMLLEVTPQITPNGRIIMDLKINQDSIGELTSGGPAIDTTQIETQVLVDNGETIVLGGIFKAETIDDVSKVPLLGDLPAVGKLFTKKTEKENKAELLIFITPKLIENNVFEK